MDMDEQKFISELTTVTKTTMSISTPTGKHRVSIDEEEDVEDETSPELLEEETSPELPETIPVNNTVSTAIIIPLSNSQLFYASVQRHKRRLLICSFNTAILVICVTIALSHSRTPIPPTPSNWYTDLHLQQNLHIATASLLTQVYNQDPSISFCRSATDLNVTLQHVLLFNQSALLHLLNFKITEASIETVRAVSNEKSVPRIYSQHITVEYLDINRLQRTVTYLHNLPAICVQYYFH